MAGWSGCDRSAYEDVFGRRWVWSSVNRPADLSYFVLVGMLRLLLLIYHNVSLHDALGSLDSQIDKP